MSTSTEYLEKKINGLAELAKVNDSFVISIKRFDSGTGNEITPEVQAIAREDLLKEKKELEAQIIDIETLLSEMDTLEVA